MTFQAATEAEDGSEDADGDAEEDEEAAEVAAKDEHAPHMVAGKTKKLEKQMPSCKK